MSDSPPSPAPRKLKKGYFDNALVEELLTRYVEGACTDRALRDEIMSHAMPLIYEVIKKKGYHRIMSPRSEDTLDELAHVAWRQIELTLYKFVPGRAKVFSFWTMVASLSVLAYVKKHTTDKCVLQKWAEKGIHGAARPVEYLPEERVDFRGAMGELRVLVSDDPTFVEIVDLLLEHYVEHTELNPGVESERPLWAVWGLVAKRYGAYTTNKFFRRVREYADLFV